mmetsp:Transcript_6403/g.9062  ORF Transcript_6403/g.9062 Transcript_6403/m.9062 type:complete len:324 (-) Transcript_6403:1101-2072(-)
MFCCFESPEYHPVSTDEKVPTTNNRQHVPTDWREYPANSSRRVVSHDPPPEGTVLLKTGGNALTAVNKDLAMSKDMVAVSVPWNVQPGQRIVVCAPDGSGQCITAVVPQGMTAGHTFMVKFDPKLPDKKPIMAVTGVPVEEDPYPKKQQKSIMAGGADATAGNIELHAMNKSLPVVVQGKDVGTKIQLQSDDLLLTEDEQQSSEPPFSTTNNTTTTASFSTEKVATVEPKNYEDDSQNLVLVKVPPGARAGQKIRFVLSDTHKTQIETVVPEGNVTEFYVAVPPHIFIKDNNNRDDNPTTQQQNWHDKPAAYIAPMVVLPFIV